MKRTASEELEELVRLHTKFAGTERELEPHVAYFVHFYDLMRWLRDLPQMRGELVDTVNEILTTVSEQEKQLRGPD